MTAGADFAPSASRSPGERPEVPEPGGFRAQLTTSAVAVVAAVALTFGNALVPRVVGPSDHKRSCAAINSEALTYATKYPTLLRYYAAPGHQDNVARLTTTQDVERCGDIEVLLERVRSDGSLPELLREMKAARPKAR